MHNLYYKLKSQKKIKKFWYNDDMIKSVFLDASSVLIPKAEEIVLFAIESSKDKVDDKVLRKNMLKLIEEEESHSEIHVLYNRMLEKEGYRFKNFTKLYNKMCDNLRKILPLKVLLAFSLSTEYLTALLAKNHIDNEVFSKGIDKRMDSIWLWHAFEELDHRSVAFDTYKNLGGGYIIRILSFLFITLTFLVSNFTIRNIFLYNNKTFFSLKTHIKMFKFLWGVKGHYSLLIIPWLNFFRPSFHPNMINIEKIEKKIHKYNIEENLKNYFPC